MNKDKDTVQTPETEETVEATETAENAETAETVEAEVTEEQQAPTEAQWREALELAVAQRDEAAKQRDEYLDSLRRAQADFQNFKRRNATSRADGYNDGVCDAITAMLPLLDNLERALAAANADDPLVNGVKMSVTAAMDGLKKFDFAEIPALGEEFDPEKHNAVMRGPGEEPNKVLEVFQKGYTAKGKILRYSMVKVSEDA